MPWVAQRLPRAASGWQGLLLPAGYGVGIGSGLGGALMLGGIPKPDLSTSHHIDGSWPDESARAAAQDRTSALRATAAVKMTA